MWQSISEYMFIVALFANAALFIPQVLLLLKKKHSDDVSLMTFLGFCLIQFFTIVHAYHTRDYLLMIGYITSLATCGTTTLLIITYRLRRNKQ